MSLSLTFCHLAGFSVEPITPVTSVKGKHCGCQSTLTSRSIHLSNANKRTTFWVNDCVKYRLLFAFAVYLSSVLVVKINSLSAFHRMTEQSLCFSMSTQQACIAESFLVCFFFVAPKPRLKQKKMLFSLPPPLTAFLSFSFTCSVQLLHGCISYFTNCKRKSIQKNYQLRRPPCNIRWNMAAILKLWIWAQASRRCHLLMCKNSRQKHSCCKAKGCLLSIFNQNLHWKHAKCYACK